MGVTTRPALTIACQRVKRPILLPTEPTSSSDLASPIRRSELSCVEIDL